MDKLRKGAGVPKLIDIVVDTKHLEIGNFLKTVRERTSEVILAFVQLSNFCGGRSGKEISITAEFI